MSNLFFAPLSLSLIWTRTEMTISIGLPDLFCGEDAESFELGQSDLDSDLNPDPKSINHSTVLSPQDNSDLESITKFIDGESDCKTQLRSNSIDPFVRAESVSWLIKAQSYHGFLPLTAYLAVNYMDQFLSLHKLPKENEWAMHLLAVTCLSLASKMEETLVPSLLDLQVEGSRFMFEPKTIRRMELLVLTSLNWRLKLVTPFTFIDFFAHKADPSGKYGRFIISRATQIILSALHDVDILDHNAWSIGAGAIICASDETLNMAFCNPVTAVTWCTGLTEEGISTCYQLMKQKIISDNHRKYPLILSQQRVTSRVNMISELSPVSLLTPLSKRRKLNLNEEIQ
ncbi:hypothetical protein LUZ60_003195 [Juncus effusus]|nr:hypothetical protein LUZ60_003195 [Juncus effusus]